MSEAMERRKPTLEENRAFSIRALGEVATVADPEARHIAADAVLLTLLGRLGCGDVVEAWLAIQKDY